MNPVAPMLFLFAGLGSDDLDSSSTSWLTPPWEEMLSLTWRISLIVVMLAAWFYALYFLSTLPWRRRERAVVLLDLIELGLRDGQAPEATLIAVSRSRDRTLAVRLHLLAAHLESGRNLADALTATPRLLPPSVQTLLVLGARHGVVPRLLPACRLALDEPSQMHTAIFQQLALFFLLGLPQCLLVIVLIHNVIVPKFGQIVVDLIEDHSLAIMQSLLAAAGWASALMLLLGGAMALWLFARVGGPWWLREGFFGRSLDRLLFLVPWRRSRMRRDFAAALAALLDARVPEAVAVREAALVAGSHRFAVRAERVAAALAAGTPLPLALSALDDAGELRWRLTNAQHGRAGFLASLRGWLMSLDARAHAQEHTAAQGFVVAGLLVQGVVVGLIVVALFHALVQITEGAVNW